MARQTGMKSYTKDWVIADKTGVEGGYVNDPNDRGGETNHGITKRVARAFGYTGKMIDLTVEQAIAIYDERYWEPLKLDKINHMCPILSDWLFDFGINAGIATAGKALQLHLNVLNNGERYYNDLAVDGIIGGATLRALHAYMSKRGGHGVANLIFALVAHQFAHYVSISNTREANEKFTYGWLTRARGNVFEYCERFQG